MKRPQHARIADQIKTPLARAMVKFPEVKAVFLFGSAAANVTRADSDLDLAIVADDSSLYARRLEVVTELVRAGLDDVDVVVLDENDIVLAFEAVRQNCLVYARGDFDRGSFFSRVVRRYFSFLPSLTIQREAQKRRLRGA